MAIVLAIDDDESILDALALILEEAGYKVITASRGDQALKILKKIKPDLIVMDIFLSGTDGRDLSRKIKSRPSTSKIPIIAISANPQAEKTALKHGADFFIPKPFGMQGFLDTVGKFVNS